MKILGIDTSTRILSISLSDKGRIIFNYNKDMGTKHSVVLLSVLDRLFKKSAQSIEDIDIFTVGLGPGSFTGLRISLSAVKAFIFALKAKVLGISSLDVIAKSVKDDGNISVISDAKRGNVYTAFYENKNSKTKRISHCLLINFKDWFKSIREKTFVLGDGAGVYRNELSKNRNIICLCEKMWYPDAKYLNLLAYEKFKKHGPDDITKIIPLYLYPKECQIRRF